MPSVLLRIGLVWRAVSVHHAGQGASRRCRPRVRRIEEHLLVRAPDQPTRFGSFRMRLRHRLQQLAQQRDRCMCGADLDQPLGVQPPCGRLRWVDRIDAAQCLGQPHQQLEGAQVAQRQQQCASIFDAARVGLGAQLLAKRLGAGALPVFRAIGRRRRVRGHRRSGPRQCRARVPCTQLHRSRLRRPPTRSRADRSACAAR